MIDIRRSILINSISCNRSELRDLLDRKYPFAEIHAFGCNGTLRHLSIKLALIKEAQFYTRSMIDTSKSQGNSLSESESAGTGYSDSQAQRSRQARNCGYSESKSFQRSVSDSESTMRSKGDANEYEEEHEYELSTDRSIQRSNGYATSYNYGDNISESDATGYSVSHSEALSEGHTRTGKPDNPPFDVDVGLPIPMITPPFVDDPIPSSNFDDVGPDTSACADCGDLCGVNFNTVQEALCNISRSWNVNYSVDWALPVGGGAATANWSWSSGGNFSQTHTVVTGRTTSGGGALNHSESEAFSESNTDGGNTSRSENLSQSDIHGMRDRLRERLQTNKAISVALSGSESKSRGESESESHNESTGAGQGTSQGRSHSENASTSSGLTTSKSESREWSQIFKSLSVMWDDTYNEIKSLNKSSSAGQAPLIGMPTQQGNQVICQQNQMLMM